MKLVPMIIAAFALLASPSFGQAPRQTHTPAKAQKTAALYVCPMHPEVTSASPGKCPKCGMTLVKAEKNTAPASKPAKKKTPSMQTKSSSENSGQTKDTSGKAATEKAAVLYTCPMHPDVVSDKPGKCPRCKMDLVKKTNDK